MEKTIVFYDTEATTWPGALQRNWSGKGEYREMVQIGAIRFNLENMEELDEFNVLIKPVKNPIVSDFFTELTGITQKQIDEKAIPFPEAYQLFTTFAGNNLTSCYGWDAYLMRENLGWYDMPNSEKDFDSLDIGPWFKKLGAPHGIQNDTNSGKLASVLGVPIKSIQEHNALHDVRSIAAAYRFLRDKGIEDFFKDAKSTTGNVSIP